MKAAFDIDGLFQARDNSYFVTPSFSEMNAVLGFLAYQLCGSPLLPHPPNRREYT